MPKQDSPQRMPMRNQHEGHFLCWHRDYGYPHLYPKLCTLYPRRVFPTPEAVLGFQTSYHRYVSLVRKITEEDAASTTLSEEERRSLEAEVETIRLQLADLDNAWAPPPHQSKWRSPIPVCSFELAKCRCVPKTLCSCADLETCQRWQKPCKCPPWHLAEKAGTDLLPTVLSHLLQDAPVRDSSSQCDLFWNRIISQDARACLSLCRPEGYFVQHRQLTKGGAVQETVPHQSGEVTIRPVTPQQDEARGMFGGVICSDELLSSKFTLHEEEQKVLPALLRWLKQNNPWVSAYATSATESMDLAKDVKKILQDNLTNGRLTPSVPKTVLPENQADTLGEEAIGWLTPLPDYYSIQGTWAHLRAAATIICKAKLQSELPEPWQKLKESELKLKGGDPTFVEPWKLFENRSFTNVSIHDPNVDAKIFVHQHPFGTGSFKSCLDCITSHSDYRHNVYTLSIHQIFFFV